MDTYSEKTRIANRFMKMNLLVIKNDKWKPQWNFTSHLLGSVIIKTVKVNEDWQECGGKMNLCTHWGCKATQPLVKTVCGFHKAFKAKLLQDPAICSWVQNQWKWSQCVQDTHALVWTTMFTAPLVTIAKYGLNLSVYLCQVHFCCPDNRILTEKAT